MRDFQVTYADHIVEVDARVAEQCGRLNVPDPLPVIDGLLAALAITHGCTLVTPSVADVARRDVTLTNPFDPLRGLCAPMGLSLSAGRDVAGNATWRSR